MIPRGLGAGLAAVLAAGGCQQSARPAPGPEAAERGRVVQFWDSYNAATGRRRAGDLSAAVERYGQALSLDPRHEDSLYYLGQCQRERGRPSEARRAFERLLDLNQESARGHQALGALLASPDPAEPLDLARAEWHFRRAHQINAEETGPMVRLSEVLIVRGRSGEAREWLEAAARTNAKSVEAAFLGGYLAWEAGDAATARAWGAKANAAALREAPVHGVLGEGDRKPVAAAPPLANTLGRTLFGDASSFLRSPPSRGGAATAGELERAWRRVREARRRLERRAAAKVPAAPAPRSRSDRAKGGTLEFTSGVPER